MSLGHSSETDPYNVEFNMVKFLRHFLKFFQEFVAYDPVEKYLREAKDQHDLESRFREVDSGRFHARLHPENFPDH